MPQTTPKLSRGELLDVAFATAWRLRAYGSYGASRKNACRAIRKRCPGFTDTQCENALDKALTLYDAVHDLVERNSKAVWDEYHRVGNDVAKMFDTDLRDRFPGFQLATFHYAVGMTFYYWHMR
jgi:hypothetical protein